MNGRTGVALGWSLAAVALLWSLTGLAGAAGPDESGSPPGAGESTPADPAPAPEAGAPSEVRIGFNFKNAPYDQVLDFFARQTGLPVLYQAPVPKGVMTFISAQTYSVSDALTILNLNLQMLNVRLSREDGYLYLRTLDEAFRQPSQVVPGDRLGDASPDELLTVYIPLNNASAEMVAERMGPFVGPHGKLVPVPTQNMLILVETAAQCRRIQEMVSQIDAVKPVDATTKVFKIRYADPGGLLQTLRTLVPEREKTSVVDKQGKPHVIDDYTKPALVLQLDERTGSIIANGSAGKIQTVAELLSILDVPEGVGGDRRLVTFQLESVRPAEAAQQLSALFQSIPEANRPTILPLDSVGKISIAGSPEQLIQARALLGELDPALGQDGPRKAQRQAKVVPLKHLDPRGAQLVLDRLLSRRQKLALTYAPTPNQRGLIVAGPEDDVAAFERLVAGVDVAPEQNSEVRLIRIESPDAAGALAKAQELFKATARADEKAPSASLDEASRTVTLIGPRVSIDRLATLLQTVQSSTSVQIETRTYELKQAKASQISPKLTRLARPLLTPDDGTPYVAPRFEPLDELHKLIVRAAPDQFAVIDELVTRLDAPEPGGRDFRVMKMRAGDPEGIIARAKSLYQTRVAGMDERDLGEVGAEYDAATGNLLITARPEAMRLFTQALTQAQQIVPPQRTTRIIDLTQVKAKDILSPLQEFLASADPIDPSRKVPDPTIRVIERTNSLLVTAEDAQHRLIADYVRRLDRLEPGDLPPLKLLQLRTADAVAISRMLSEQYNKRSSADRMARPVEVRADAATNTLIVSAHEELFDEIKSFVDDLNKEDQKGPERVTVLFPLKVAKAEAVATAMDKLYPQPPMPRDRRGNPMPWLQKDKEVTVSAEPSSNSLIIDAPAERIESLQELAAKLDRVELPPTAQVRTYKVIGADLNAVSQTLQGLARSGALSGPAQPGKQPVKVLIETEPMSSTLIVAGDQDTFDTVDQILTSLMAVPIEKQLRIIPIANSEASDVRERALAIYNAQIESIPDAHPVDVTIDEQTNSLEVVGDRDAMRRFMQVIDELQRQTGPAREVRMIELRYAKAAEVAAFLDDMVQSSESMSLRIGPDPVFEPIEATNTLMVAAQPTQFAIIEQLVRNLDNQSTAERPPLRILRLRTTDAVNLAGVLQRSYQTRSLDERTKKPVDIQADPATNTLIVSAHPDVLTEIQAIVEELNETQTLGAEDREIRIFPLKFARAQELARTIDEMFPEPPIPYERDRYGRTRPRPDLREPKEVFVRADAATNSLIVDAPSKRLAGFEQIVQSLDKQNPAENVEVRTYRIRHADLNAVASSLRDLANQGALGQRGRAPVSISTEPATRTLIVSGPSEIFDGVSRVLDQFDGALDRPATVMRTYRLAHARADRLQTLLTRILTTRAREQLEQDGAAIINVESLIDVAADSASNTLIISAPEAMQKLAEQLIQTLDTEASASGRTMLRVVPLTYAEAAQVASALNSVLPRIELPTGGPVSVMPAAGSNALLLTGAEKDLAMVETIIKPLDSKPIDSETPGVETFALVNADATSIAPTVQRLLIEQQKEDPRVMLARLRYTRGRDLFQKPKINVEADARTNSLIVSAPASTLELARTIIERLDQPAQDVGRVAVTFTPKRADPATLARTVQKVVSSTMPQGRVPLELTPEPKTGSIVVLGTSDQVAEAVRRLTDADERSPVLPGLDVRVFDLVNADPTAVARTLQGMLSDRSRWPESLRQVERAGLRVPQPSASPDSKAGRVLVSAPSDLMGLASQLVQTLDQPPAGGAVEIRVLRLSEGDSESVAGALRAALSAAATPGSPAPTVTPEPRSNTIVISGSGEQIERASELVRSMDLSVEPDGSGVRTIRLKHARAEALAPVVESVLVKRSVIDKVPDWAKVNFLLRSRQPLETDQPVRVVAEPRLNALVVSGPVPVLTIAEQVIAELDADPALGGPRRLIRVISLVNADATELAASIDGVFDEDQSTDPPPVIRVERQSNSLVVRATGAQMETIESLIRRLDSAALVSSRQMRMIAVDRSKVDAGVMARTLKRLLEKQGGVRVQVISTEDLLKESKPESEPDQENETPDQGAKPKTGPIGLLTRPGLPGTTNPALLACSRVILSLAIAAPVPAVDEDQPARDEEQAAGGIGTPGGPDGADAAAAEPDERPVVRIAVDPATNSLIVIGSPRVTDRLAALAAQLEKEMPAEPTRVRIVTLPESADARAIKAIVDQTVRQVGQVGAQNPGGFTGRVTVTPDPTGGALIVWANDTDFDSVGALIASVSRLEATTELTVKVYPLVNVRADRAAQAVGDLVNPRPRGRVARQVRSAFMTIQADGQEVAGRIDPGLVRVTADPSRTSLIVAAPAGTIPLIDRFISVIDQSPVTDRLAIRRYELNNADAAQLSRTFQALFDSQRQGPSVADMPRARFVADDRTNSILVTASAEQHAEVGRLLATADAETPDDGLVLEIFPLQNAQADSVQRIVEQAVIGRDPAKRDRVQLSSDRASNLFVVRAEPEVIEQIRQIVDRVDTSEVSGPPVRSIRLERADAAAVAAALQRFFQSRAQAASRAGRRVTNTVSITGDRRSGTLVVSASDEDFAQIQGLVEQFDSPAAARDLQFHIVPLKHARVTDIENTIQNLSYELQYERVAGARARRGEPTSQEGRLFIETNERTNSVVVMGEGPIVDQALKIIGELDQPSAEQTRLVVKAVPVEKADLNALRNIIQQAFQTPGWRPWYGPDPDSVRVEVDPLRRNLILVGKQPVVEQAQQYIAQLDEASGRPDAQIVSIPLRYANAARASRSLTNFFRDRARIEGMRQSDVSVIGSQDGNVLIVSAGPEDLKVVNDLIAQIDRPELGDDRRIEVYALVNADANETATAIRSLFPRSGRAEDRVLVTPRPSTNSLIVSSPAERFDEVDDLIQRLDSPPELDNTQMVAITLQSARADEAARALRSALPTSVKVTITPVPRANLLWVTGSPESIALVRERITEIDTGAAPTMVAFRRVRLEHAVASDTAFTLRSITSNWPRSRGDPAPAFDYNVADNTLVISATPGDLDQISRIITELDVAPQQDRRTEFVKLKFADAEQIGRALEVFYGTFAPAATTPGARNTRIVPDPASGSLVISADEKEWEGIRALITKLDTPEYDTSRQLEVIPLLHADATSVARALNEGFRAPLEDQFRRAQARRSQRRGAGRGRDGQDDFEPIVLAPEEGAPTVSAEVQTNSLIVFAGRRDLDRIKAIVEQLDVPDFAMLPDVHVLPLATGKASDVARVIQQMFRSSAGDRPGGPRSVMVVGDDASGALIIRADDQTFEQIRALAESIQAQGDKSLIQVRVLPLKNVPAARVRQTVQATFSTAAQQLSEPLSIEVDRGSNALVIASSQRLFEQIREVAQRLDAGPGKNENEGEAEPIKGGLGQSVTIIDVKNNAPADVQRVLVQMGLTGAQPVDRPGVVSEPVRIVAMTSRRAIAVVAGPADARIVEALVRAIDAEPIQPEQAVRLVPLKMADAARVVATVRQLLQSSQQDSPTGPARALAEQVRRLNITRDGLGQDDLRVDLSLPIRLIAETQSNAVIVASTPGNVEALSRFIELLDALPIGDAVVIRIFPLENAAASRVRDVLQELFAKGKVLGRLPGTQRRGLPTTATGQALAGEIGISVDERTNALIVGGSEEAVALVEVLVKDLDSDRTGNWVEPRIIRLQYADAVDLSGKLREILVQGLAGGAEALGLQRQVARLRVLREGGDPKTAIQADLFAPMSGLVITPEEHINALIVVGSEANVAVVSELVKMLDVERAAASNTVRVFPLEFAAADRISAMVSDFFTQREQTGTMRPEDRLFITSDTRTNSLIVSTSPRSFEILDHLLKTLDGQDVNYSVGLHVIPVVGADVRQLAPQIQTLMRDRIAAGSRGGVRSPKDAFRIEPEPATNSLIVAASDENLLIVKELVDTLMTSSAGRSEKTQTELVQIKSGSVSDVAQWIQQIYVDRENAKRGERSVAVVPNDRLNALIVSGTAEDISAVRELVGRFDAAEPTIVRQVKRIELRKANAREARLLLENVIAGRPLGGGRGQGRPATRLIFQARAQKQLHKVEAQFDGSIRDQVTITEDLRTNSLMVSAPPEVMTLIEAIIADLEQTKAGDRKIETFTLTNADARQMAIVLSDLFSLQQQGDRFVLVPVGQRQPDKEKDKDQQRIGQTLLTPVPDQRQELSITIDARTNSLLVSGTEEYLKLVRDVVEKLDLMEGTDRLSKVFQLKNAQASEVETTLQRYFREEADRIRQRVGPAQLGSLSRQLEQEVTVVGDSKSQNVLVTTSPRYMDTVSKIIDELDAPPSQVMIQVLLAEVTLDSTDSFGIDLSVNAAGGASAGFRTMAAGAGVTTALGVPNLSVSAADFDLLIRALNEQGKLNVLSRPEMTVHNNETANMQVGEEIRLVTNVQRSNTGDITSTVEARQVGVILQVTPSISADGFVHMQIAPEISSLSQRTVQISEDFLAPIIDTRTLNTTVTVKDGQTVVIGGLIQSRDEERKTKVPFLGDIPILGIPFRSHKISNIKTELLIIITPHVIPGERYEAVNRLEELTKQSIDDLANPGLVKEALKGRPAPKADGNKPDQPDGADNLPPIKEEDEQEDDGSQNDGGFR